jgi:ribonuclease P protein component
VKRIIRLTHRSDFIKAANAPRWQCRFFNARVRLRDTQNHVAPAISGLRLGLTVTKKMGNSPQRNRIRRRLKGILRVLCADEALWVLPLDVVIIARESILTADHPALLQNMQRLMLHLHEYTRLNKHAQGL